MQKNIGDYLGNKNEISNKDYVFPSRMGFSGHKM